LKRVGHRSGTVKAASTHLLLRGVLERRARREWAEAAAVMDEAERAAEGDAEAQAAIGDVRTLLGEYESAHASYDRAVALAPNRARLWFNRGALRRILGQLEAAEADYDRCLSLDPSDAQAYLNRAELRVQSHARNHIAELEGLVVRGFSSWLSEVPIRYALAKEYEDLGEYRSAWRNLCTGATLRRRHLQYNLAADLATVDWLIKAFPAGRPRPPGTDTSEPIFIVGMPRTGSTLLDRMLGNHSQIYSAGELVHLSQAVVAAAQARLGRGGSRQELVAASANVDFAALGKDYLERTRPQTGHTPRFIDKLPLNYLYCGLIDSALPNAHIVLTTRHPVATCFGAFKVLFEQGYPFSYDLQELADYYAGYERLMAHWRQVLPDRLIEVTYERLVTEPERECRRIIDALGLKWEPACLEHEKNPAPTATASAVQVRREIYQTSLSQWRHFATELAPLCARLESHGIRIE